MANQQIISPIEIKQGTGQNLVIRWQDEHESIYACNFLRRHCRCAVCVDEWTGQILLKEDQIPSDIHPMDLQGVGRYGIRINWSDGHNTGIYTFKYLREICPCEICNNKLSS